MSGWLLPREELTPDQLRAIELPHNQHQVIFGAPGSGKTMVLLHRADELRHRMKSDPNKFRILVFTNVLKNYIRSGLDVLQIPEKTVTTFDDWCMEFYKRHIDRKVPWDGETKRPDFSAIRYAVGQRVRSMSSPLLDFVLVDEGQDLEPECFDILCRVARHVTVCLDYKQQIYDRGSTEAQIVARLGLHRRQITLLDAFRCSPLVAGLAARLLQDPEERHQYLNQVRTAQKEREWPLLYEATSFEDERRKLIEIVRDRVQRGERLGVLFPKRKQVMGFAQALESEGFRVETQKNLDFSSAAPKLITYHSAKGLTFDAVLLPRLVYGSFTKISQEAVRRQLFVAITRATQWVYLSTVQGERLLLLQDLDALAEQGQLVRQQGGYTRREDSRGDSAADVGTHDFF
jgi:superfamily I DNA/RNA helicase